ncbi:MAG: helix-hairpin-helix domain-containing protein [Myxococcota bacterium]
MVGIASAWAQALLDVNAATVAQLDALPGIGPAKARALVVWREEVGPCKAVADLGRVPGWGAATLAGLRSRVTCGPGITEDEGVPGAIEELDGPALHTERVDINSAGPYRLTELPGISLSRAQDIVAHREAAGPFESCAALADLPGIGRATVEVLEDRCAVSRPARR